MKKSGQVYEIIRADIEEVSLVNAGANRRTFFLIKFLTGGTLMKSFAKAYLDLFGSEPNENLLKTIESLDEGVRKERTEALETLAEFKDDFDEDVSKALETLITNVPVIKEVVEKEVTTLSPEIKTAIENLNKAANIDPSTIKPDSTGTDTTETQKAEGDLVSVDLDELEKEANDKAAEIVKQAQKNLTT